MSAVGALSRSNLRRPLLHVWRRLRGGRASPERAALSLGIGVFIGCIPLPGAHWFLCLAVCLPLRLDAVLAYLGANISNPFLAPLLYAAELEIGALLLTGEFVKYPAGTAVLDVAGDYAAFLGVGALVLAALLGAASSGAAWLVVRDRRRCADAFERTRRRYRNAPRGDRAYVRGKLARDPVCSAILELRAPLGFTVDAGCGRGQLGLLLLEAGRAERLCGFDWDTRKVELARRAAAGTAARYRVGELSGEPIPRCDTVLLVDVLHYLKPGEQQALLERAAASLTGGGRLLIRDVDSAGGLGARLAMAFERWGWRLGMNRASGLHFLSAAELLSKLEALGLSVRAIETGAAGVLANVLVVATRSPASDAAEQSS